MEERELQKFVCVVESMASDFYYHDIDINYEFYGSLTLKELLIVCKKLQEAHMIKIDDSLFEIIDMSNI